MKKALASITVVTLLAFGAIAYAGPGYWGGGHMMGYGTGPGYGMGPGSGGHMYGWTGGYDQKFLDETADLRKELHEKKFEYFEATRNPDTTAETITKLEKEISDIQDKLFAKAPRKGFGKRGGYGKYGGYGCNW
jgi:hypothetical protein